MKRLVLVLALVISVGQVAEAKVAHICETDAKAATAKIEAAAGFSLETPETLITNVLGAAMSGNIETKEAAAQLTVGIKNVKTYIGIMRIASKKAYDEVKSGVNTKSPSGMAISLTVGLVDIMTELGEEIMGAMVVGLELKAKGQEPSKELGEQLVAKLEAVSKKVEAQKANLEAAQKAIAGKGVSAKEKEKFGKLATAWAAKAEVLVCKAAYKAFVK